MEAWKLYQFINLKGYKVIFETKRKITYFGHIFVLSTLDIFGTIFLFIYLEDISKNVICL